MNGYTKAETTDHEMNVKGVQHPKLKISIFVCYLKIINTYFEK